MHTIAILLSICAPAQQDPAANPAPTSQHFAPAAPEAPAESGSRMIDPEDGWFDVSKFLEHPAGFLPVIVPIQGDRRPRRPVELEARRPLLLQRRALHRRGDAPELRPARLRRRHEAPAKLQNDVHDFLMKTIARD